MSVGIVGQQLVRALVGSPEGAVVPHVDAVDVHRRARARIPLIEKLSVLVEHLNASVVAVVDVHAARLRVHRDPVHAVEVAGPALVRRRPLHAPLEQLLAVHVVLDDARPVVAVGEIPGIGIHERHERGPAEVRVIRAWHAGGAERQEALLAVVRELADEVRVRVDDPDVLLRIVRADLDVVRASPDAIPLRPVFDHLAVAIEHHDHVLPAPVDARTPVALVHRLAEAGCRAGRFAHRHAAADGELEAGPDLRQPRRAAPASARQHRQLALERHEHAILALGKDIRRLGVRPVLVIRQALAERPWPVLHRVVRPEDVLPALASWDGGKALARRLPLLSLDNAEPAAHEHARGKRNDQRRNLERSSCHVPCLFR